ncbi:hypothetical protein HN415_10350, partial [Candidatus Woesearchaeota archaeon]|nr:hypothetical protein [Candidatus Woesearchaeota archaeon]
MYHAYHGRCVEYEKIINENKMTGTLELLVGPSAVGKTTSIGSNYKSIRYSTRDIRDTEKDSKLFNGNFTTDGYFIKENEFFKRKKSGDFIGVHQYPDDKGDWYAFDKNEIQIYLNQGKSITEQLDDFSAVKELKAEYKNSCITKLFYGVWTDLFFNMINRPNVDLIKNFKRINKYKKNLMLYNENINYFDEIYVNIPIMGKLKKKAKKIIDQYYNWFIESSDYVYNNYENKDDNLFILTKKYFNSHKDIYKKLNIIIKSFQKNSSYSNHSNF